MPIYIVPVTYAFPGHFEIEATCSEQAHELAKTSCGMTQGQGVHSSLPEHQAQWEFPWHPLATVGSPKAVSPESSVGGNSFPLASDIDQAWEVYLNTLEHIADVLWGKIVKPYLAKNKISFYQSNGDWWVRLKGKMYHPADFNPLVIKYNSERGVSTPNIFQDDEGLKVYTILQAETPGINSSLASFFPSAL